MGPPREQSCSNHPKKSALKRRLARYLCGLEQTGLSGCLLDLIIVDMNGIAPNSLIEKAA